MRTLIALTLLTALAAAQDGAPELFYRAFWLEQAEGKHAEAEALYGRILEEHADAAEAPRALLGIVRIRARMGADVADLAAKLAERYPAAKEEIAQARKLAEAGRGPFDPRTREDDSPVTRKLKALWFDMEDGSIFEADRAFVLDVGVAAHPLLEQLLRHSTHGVVELAAGLLLEQDTKDSRALVAQALGDDAVLFKAAILEALREHETADPRIVRAVAALAQAPTPRLAQDAARTIGDLAAHAPEPKADAYAALTALLRADDADLGTAALKEWTDTPSRVPGDCVDALLARIEARRWVDERHMAMVPWFVLRPGLEDRVERILLIHGPVKLRAEPTKEVGAFLVRVAFKLLDAGKLDRDDTTMFRQAAEAAPSVAASVIREALGRGDARIVAAGWQGVRGRSKDVGEVHTRLGADLAPLRRSLLEALHSGDPGRVAAARSVLGWFGIGTDFELVDSFLQESQAGLTEYTLQADFLRAVGPEKAGRLVRHARNAEEAGRLLAVGMDFLGKDESAAEGAAFFEQVLPKVGPDAIKYLDRAGRYANLRPIVARRLLDATGEEWGWAAPQSDVKGRTGFGGSYSWERQPGPYLWVHREVREACFEPPLLAAMPARVVDPREEIAKAAAMAAAKLEDEAALRRALESPHPSVRSLALMGLVGPGDRGAGVLAEYLRRDGIGAEDRGAVWQALRKLGPAHAARFCEELLSRRDADWSSLWNLYLEVAPDRAVARALVDAVGDGPEVHRDAALHVLTRTDDPRRIEVFRRVLAGPDESEVRIRKVVSTVAEQYLIELGEETLRHLRSPDKHTRDLATSAIERLKFYADAKRTFKDE